MILDKRDQEFFYEGKRYFIGQQIVGTKASEYEGLFGIITEIRDGEDKDTENETPDIYCNFEVPEMPYDIKALEERFSDLYDEPKTIDDIILDIVIMAPEMIEPLDAPCLTQKIYIVVEDSVYGEDRNVSISIATNMEEAKKEMRLMFRNEMMNGYLREQLKDEDYIVKSDETSYIAYPDGDSEAEHYILYIEEHEMVADTTYLQRLAPMCLEARCEEDFGSHLAQKLECGDISEEQYEYLAKYAPSGQEVVSALSKNDSYFNAYWQTMSNIVHDRLSSMGGTE